MKLEELVPNIELCKLIPEGEFGDSCFAWSYSCDKRKTEPFVDYREDIEFCRRNMVNYPDVYPAPTLEEIIKKLPSNTILSKEQYGYIYSCGASGVFTSNEEHGADATLKLWLELKGIQYE